MVALYFRLCIHAPSPIWFVGLVHLHEYYVLVLFVFVVPFSVQSERIRVNESRVESESEKDREHRRGKQERNLSLRHPPSSPPLLPLSLLPRAPPLPALRESNLHTHTYTHTHTHIAESDPVQITDRTGTEFPPPSTPSFLFFLSLLSSLSSYLVDGSVLVLVPL